MNDNNGPMNEDAHLDSYYESRYEIDEPYEREDIFEGYGDYEDSGWPGDGSGTDDLADMNANEADDYQNEDCLNDCDEDFYDGE